jgi:hypothetical protein
VSGRNAAATTTKETHMHRHNRAVTVAILSVAALFVVFAGTATAGNLLTGKDIKNGSIARVDLKAESVTSAKLADSAKTSVRFDEDNTTGIDLPACSDTALDSCTSLLAVGMTPGSYVVTANGSLDNTNGAVPAISNRCGIYRGSDVLTETRFALAANSQPGELQSFSLQQVIKTSSSAPVSLRCTEMPGEALRLSEVRLTVLKVGKIG